MLLIYTALSNEPVNGNQKKWWWAFLGSLLLEIPLMMAALLALYVSDNYKPVANPDEVDNPKSTTKPGAEPENSASTSYKTILTINSIPQSTHQSKKHIKTVNPTPQQELMLQQQKLQAHRSHRHHHHSIKPLTHSYKFGQALVLQKIDNQANNPDPNYMKSGMSPPVPAKPTSATGDPTQSPDAAALMTINTVAKSPTTVIDMPTINKMNKMNMMRQPTTPIGSDLSPSASNPISATDQPANMAAVPSRLQRKDKDKRKTKRHSNGKRKRDKANMKLADQSTVNK